MMNERIIAINYRLSFHVVNKRPSRQTVWHLIFITLFGLPLISPLLRATAVPCTHDGHLHYHRIAAMRHAWENGLFFTRWLPDLAFGYGYPFFIYREPVPLYAGLIPHLLGLPLPAAENFMYILAILAEWLVHVFVGARYFRGAGRHCVRCGLHGRPLHFD